MRNTVFFFFLLLLISPFRGLGQTDSTHALPRPYVEGNIGLGLAPRALFMPSSTAEWMDYVKPGYCAGLSGEMPLFQSWFGARAFFEYYSNSFDMKKYTGVEQAGVGSSSVTSISYGVFTQYAFGLGAFASHSFNKLTIELYAVAGGEYLSLPNTEVDVKITSPGQSEYTNTVIYSTKLQFGYGGGIDAAYNVSKQLSLSLAIDCQAAKVPYKYTIYEDYIQHINYQYNYTGTATVFITGIKVGLRYSFGG